MFGPVSHWFSELRENYQSILGVFVTLLLLTSVAVARCLLNRASVSRVERVREHVEKLMVHGQTNDTNSQLITPMLESGESSRCTTASHSRTSSEGVTPHYAVLNKGKLFSPAPFYVDKSLNN